MISNLVYILKKVKDWIKEKIFKKKEFKNPILISTMTRSGTWYNREFYYFYNELLKGRKKKDIFNNMVATHKKLKYRIPTDMNKLGFDIMFIQHWLCPGFVENYNGKYKKKWNELNFYSSHVPGKFTEYMKLKNVEEKVNPYKNSNSKVIFYFRNPLDQNVAYFKGIQDHKDRNLLSYMNKETNKREYFKNISHFLKTVGMDMYIKHFLSFKLTEELFPNNILLMSYENMVRDPEENFIKSLKFLGHNIKLKKYESEFFEALDLSSKESIMALEKRYGHAISRSFNTNNAKHIKDAKVGKWEGILNDDDLKYIDLRLNEFGLKLDNFQIN
tara:strand:+ start:3302 stop:4291 length:990 start_codon:yes stop_codon:yes gene_type:complete